MAGLRLFATEATIRLTTGFDTLPEEVRNMIVKHETIDHFGGNVYQALDFIYALAEFCTQGKDKPRKKENYSHLV